MPGLLTAPWGLRDPYHCPQQRMRTNSSYTQIYFMQEGQDLVSTLEVMIQRKSISPLSAALLEQANQLLIIPRLIFGEGLLVLTHRSQSFTRCKILSPTQQLRIDANNMHCGAHWTQRVRLLVLLKLVEL